jgi:AsmA protein
MPSTAPPQHGAGKFRRLPCLIALVAVCGALLVFALPLVARQVIGAQRLKAVAEQALTDALGRRVTIAGEVSVVFTPWLGLAMGPVSIAEGPGFGDGPMLTARRLEMTIRMLPLAARVVSPGSVRVRDLAVHLRRDASGRGNWQDLTAPQTTQAAEAPGWEIAPEPRDIQLENASVDYADAASGRTMSVREVNLKTGHGQPFSFSLSFRAEGFLPGGLLECHAGGKASLDAASGAFTLEKTLVETGLVFTRPLVAGGASPTRIVSRVHAAYDPATAKLSLTGLDARLPGARLTGSGLVDAPVTDPKARVALDLDLDMAGTWRELLALTPAERADNLIAAPQNPAREPDPVAPEGAAFTAAHPAPAPGRAALTLTATAEAGRVAVEKFALALPKGRIEGSGRFTPGAGATPPALDASLRAEDVDFGALPMPAGRATWPWPLPWPTAGLADTRLMLRNCTLGGLAVADGYVTGQARHGILRLAPASFSLPGGIVSVDARFDAGLPPDAGGDAPPESLGIDIRASVQPFSREAGPIAQPTVARLLGRLHAEGAKGNLMAQSPDAARALAVLGLGGFAPSAGPLDVKSAFAVSPGINRLVAKASLSGLEGRLAGATLHGQAGYDATAPVELGFDLVLDSLDLEHPPALAGGAPHAAGSGAAAPKAAGKLRIERLTGRGVDARNLALDLTLQGGGLEGAVAGGELFGGRLSGKFDIEPSGRVAGSLQLAGADARRLPGVPGASGAVAVKAAFDAAAPAKGRPGAVSATIEADAPQLSLGAGAKAHPLSAAKATLTLKGRRAAGEGFEGEASLVAGLGSGFGLREARLTAACPVALDMAGKLRDPAPVKLEGSGLLRPGESGRPVKVTLTGQATPDGAGGLATSELRLDAGGLPASLKLSRKGGAGAPTNFSLETGTVSPRKVLADWGVALPAGLAADKLAKASVSLSGTATADACDIKRLQLGVDDVTVTGNAQLVGFDPKHGKWDLRVDRLDWDAYFPRQPASPGPPPLAERRKPLDLRFLRELSLDAKASIGWLKKGNVTFDASTVTASAKGGQFTYRQESSRFYGGRFSTDIRGDARDTALKMLIELKLEGIEIARFLWDWAEGNTLDSGAGTFIVAARTSGENEEELRGNLAGNASLQITRGNLKVREPASKTGGEPTYERLPFSIFSSSWFAKGGVAHSDDFLIESPRMRVAGKGFVDLRDESINLSLNAALTGGGDVPATIIGPLDGPKLTIDRSKLIGDTVYRVLQGIVSIPGKAVTRILQLR